MTEKIKVSVLLTSYNHAQYLHDSINSVLNQTFTDFELIIWDDASTDESWQIINSYSDLRIRAFRSETPNNIIRNIRTAISETARGEYIAIHHSDDVWEPQKLEKQQAYLEANPQIGAVFSWAQMIDEAGHPFQDPDHFYHKIFEQPNHTRHEWLNYFYFHGNALCHPSLLIRKTCYDDCGLYRYGFAQLPDFDMWVRLCLKHDIHVMPEKLVRFRIRSNELNTSGNRPDVRIRWQFEFLQVLDNYKNIPSLQELARVFPTAEKYLRPNGYDLGFALGMVALEAKTNPITELFGLNTLFEIFNDPDRMEKVSELYDFSQSDFIALTAQHDVFSSELVTNLKAQVQADAQTIQSVQGELREIKSGTKWKIFQFMIRMRQTLLPSGSSREKIIYLLMRALRVFRLEGARAILHRVINRLKQILKRYQRALTQLFSRPAPIEEGTAEIVYVPLNDENVDPEKIQVKLIAFYLPQFHPIPENDQWWGKGFTEWTNVSKAVPNFEGHYQPHQPDELGFYDLRIPDVQKRQVELAKKYGVYGFCFYYYWFAGKRLLERPLDQYLANPNLDLPFCLCWANENWTRRWDGAEHEILIGQVHNEAEYLHFIRDISPNFLDPRYIRMDGKPLLLVYRINLLPDPEKAAEIWRAECRRLGIGEIYLAAVQSFGITDPRPYGFDAAVEFPPSGLSEAQVSRKSVKITNPKFQGKIFDYNLVAELMFEKEHGDYDVFKSVMPSWDNTARKQNDSHIFINASPSAYKAWLAKTVRYSQKSLPADQRFIFVNAWNEWAEGTHLEPDRLYGYAYLQATAEAISNDPANSDWTILFISHDANKGGAQAILLNILAWFKAHTHITIKVICLHGGVLLPNFKTVADTLILDDLIGGSETPNDQMIQKVLEFCDGKPDLIYGNTVVSGEIYASLASLGVPIISHVHELETSIKFYADQWIGDVIAHSTHFIACSSPVRENLIQTYNVPPEKITTIYESIFSANQPMLNADEKKRLRKKLGLKQGAHIIFGCGIGLPYRKGADLFIELGRTLKKKGIKDFHLYWVGGFADSASDPEHGSWREHLARLHNDGLDTCVTFLGLKDNPREYLRLGDIFVLPSREDPFPLVALEAADCGLPVICFAEAGGIPDFVEEDAGYVVTFGDVNAMAEKVATLLQNQELRQLLGNQAREKLVANFTVERTTPQILSICRKIADKKPAVSVIVPNYNHARYLPERLESVFNQTFQDFEVILLDDASIDNSLAVLKKYEARSNTQIIQNAQNSGSPFIQWLKGIELAQAGILWVAESDDVADLNFLKTLLPAFRHPNIKLAYANSYIINENSEVLGDYLNTEYLASLSPTKWDSNYQVSAEREINEGLGIKNTILNMSAVLFRKFDLEDSLGNTLSGMHIMGDWHFIVCAIRSGFLAYNSQKLNYHRRHSQSVIGQTLQAKKAEEFFKEFFVVQNYIFKKYKLLPDFREKWEIYLRRQWADFFPDRPFDEINDYYPYEKINQLLKH